MSAIKRTIALVLTVMSIIAETKQDENIIFSNPKMTFNKTAIMEMKPWECTLRLSKFVRPIQYALYISSNLETNSFTGSVEITIALDSPQNFIKLHSSELDITETTLDSNPVTAFSYSKYQFWVVVPDNEICAGIHTLRMKFDGCLSNTMIGFYRSDYYDEGTYKQHTIVTTQFEPTFARTTFPCFDEPEMKSQFQINVTRPSGNNFIALSNMNQECEEPVSPANGLTVARFANTLPMSTYLVCFIVCDFQASETLRADQGFLIRTFAQRSLQKNTKYASSVALKAINYYVEYFAIEYPLPKLDIIAIPDFEAGAMENWGLITFRETKLLYDECTSSSTSKSSVAYTVCHELAHMWFGDLVTMAWWSDIWLNEGFATFMSTKVIEIIQPDWDYGTMFLTNKLHKVLDKDSQINSHPIVQEVYDPLEIDSAFDVISYNKGASILRMLEGMLGADVLRTGIRAYLNRYKFCNAQTDDLWYEIQTASTHVTDIKKVMHTWTQQEGYPVVTATLRGTTLTLEQRRFLIDSNAAYCADSSPFKYRWEIPLTYVTSENDIVHKLWLCSDQSSVTVELPGIEWIKINYRQQGFYIVNYSKNNWCALSNLLQTNINALSAADRANLLYDAFNLADAQYLTYDIPLEITKYLVGECHFVPWTVVNDQFFTLWSRLYDRCEYPEYEKYLRYLLGGIKDDVWNVPDVQTFSQSRYRLAVIKLGALCGEPTYGTKIHEMFKKFLYENIAINPDIKEDIYNYGIAYGDADDWNHVWHLYLKEQDPDEKILFLVALSYSRDTTLLKRLIQFGITGSYVRPENLIDLLVSMSKNPLANPIAWDFIRCNWQFLLHYLSSSNIGLGTITISICDKFNTQQRLDEMNEFFKNYPDAGAAKSDRETALETVVQNINWLERNEVFIVDWLKNNNH